MCQRDMALSLIAAKLAACLPRTTVGRQLCIANKASNINGLRTSDLVKKSDVILSVQRRPPEEKATAYKRF